jgi:16S rRNA (guanine966-N2)-methyltransferase
MRIVAGRWRGKRLADVGQGDAGAHLRPTTDRVRESLFNVLMGGKFGNPIQDARVLDLFAGTGALGLEALSRGAAHATFVDDGQAARALLRENIGLCQAQGMSKVFRRSACDLGPAKAPCDLVFLDPPYGQGLGEAAIVSAIDNGWLAPNALVIWEENATPLAPPTFELEDQRRYGSTAISIYRVCAQ